MKSKLSGADKILNAKILDITMVIKTKYPELIKYLEEMTVTIPDETHPEIGTKSLNDYYDSLNAMLNKYLLEQTHKGK